MVAFGCFWVLLGAFGCFWLLLAAFGCFWLPLVAFFSFWLLSVALGYFWLLLVALGWRSCPSLSPGALTSPNTTQKDGSCVAGAGDAAGCRTPMRRGWGRGVVTTVRSLTWSRSLVSSIRQMEGTPADCGRPAGSTLAKVYQSAPLCCATTADTRDLNCKEALDKRTADASSCGWRSLLFSPLVWRT